MFLCSLVEELCTKEENDKRGCNFNFGHECIRHVKLNASVLRYNGYVSLGLHSIQNHFAKFLLCKFRKSIKIHAWSVVLFLKITIFDIKIIV